MKRKNKLTAKDSTDALLNVQTISIDADKAKTAIGILKNLFDSPDQTAINRLAQTERKQPNGPELENEPLHTSCPLIFPKL